MLTQNQKRIVLVGNPNAGKTTLFNALTKSNLRTGNFHGVTTLSFEKQVENATFVDAPGLYSLSPYSQEEWHAVEQIQRGDIIVNVIDAFTLEPSLNLTKKLIALNKPIIVYVTKTNFLKKKGGSVDIQKLSKFLGVPVYDDTCKNFREIVVNSTKSVEKDINLSLNAVYTPSNNNANFLEKAFLNPYFSLLVFLISITLMFFLTFHPKMIGAYLKGVVSDGIENLFNLLIEKCTSKIVKSFIYEVVVLGVGGVFSFIPQLCVLYLFLTILDESGVMSSLAFATDGIFEKVNLSGRAAFSLISGFGCTTSAILTSGGYSTKSAQKRTVAILPYIPCGAKLPVFLTFLSPLFENPFPIITCFYFSGLALSLLFCFILKGQKENMLSEVAPIVFPSIKTTLKKLCFYAKAFIIKIGVTITLFCVASWLLSHFTFKLQFVEGEGSVLAAISKVITPLFYPMGIHDWQLAYASICGFIAKENIAASITMLMPNGANLSLASALSLCTFILLSPPCISALSASHRELGLKFTLQCLLSQLVLAFLGSYIIFLVSN